MPKKSFSQEPNRYRILFVLDASGSMYGKWQGKLKMESAKKVLSKLVDSISTIPRVEMALRVYGHQYQRNCEDTKLEVPFRANNSVAIKDVLQRINPKGITPIAFSLEQAAYDFPNTDNIKNIIILITDGVEECGGDPCAVSAALQSKNVILQPFIIGLGIDPSLTGKFKCMGRYFNASSESSLSTIMKVVVSTVLDNTSIQVKLLDHNNKATETDVNMTFSDINTGITHYNLIHTLDANKQADKFVIDASPIYEIKVHTIPPIYKKPVILKPGENNVVEIPAIQGYLKVQMNGSMYYKDLQCVVYKAGTNKLVNTQSINSTVKYLAGKYDIVVLTTPVTRFDGVHLTSKATKQLEVQNPGQVIVTYNSNFIGGVYAITDTGIQKVMDVSADANKGIFYLQPGNYRFILRKENDTKTLYTKYNDFLVRSNGTIRLNIN